MMTRAPGVLVWVLSATACGSAGDTSKQEGACKTELFQLSKFEVVDPSAKASAVACEASTGSTLGRSYTRVDVLGDNLCPGSTTFASHNPPECESNDDCDTSEVCICSIGYQMGRDVTIVGAYPNRCVPAECRGSDDCGGKQCGLSSDMTTTPNGLFCRTSADECSSDADCMEQICVYKSDHWGCGTIGFPEDNP